MIDITQWRIAIGTHHLRWRRNSNYGLTTLGEYHVDRLMFFITVSVKVFITMHVFITMLLLLQAGDVESNPGPNFLRTCPNCDEKVPARKKLCKCGYVLNKKIGRPTGTSAEAGFRVTTGRAVGTTAEAGYKVSNGRTVGTTAEAGYKVSNGRTVGTTAEAGYKVSNGRSIGTSAEAGYKVSNGRSRGTTEEAGFHVSCGRPVVYKSNTSDKLITTDVNCVSLSDELLALGNKRIAQQVRFDSKPLAIGMCYCCGSILWSRVDNSHTNLVDIKLTEGQIPAVAYQKAMLSAGKGLLEYRHKSMYACAVCKTLKCPSEFEFHVGKYEGIDIEEWDMRFPEVILNLKNPVEHCQIALCGIFSTTVKDAKRHQWRHIQGEVNALHKLDRHYYGLFGFLLINEDLSDKFVKYPEAYERIRLALHWLKKNNHLYQDFLARFETLYRYVRQEIVNPDVLKLDQNKILDSEAIGLAFPVDSEYFEQYSPLYGEMDIAGIQNPKSHLTDKVQDNIEQLRETTSVQYGQKYLLEKTFPHLFPYGKGGWFYKCVHGLSHFTKTKLMDCRGYFSNDQNFPFFMFDYMTKMRLRQYNSKKIVAVSKLEQSLTAGEVIAADRPKDNDNYASYGTDVPRVIPGSKQYWKSFGYDLIATVEQLGVPDYFITLSPNDNWPQIQATIRKGWGASAEPWELNDLSTKGDKGESVGSHPLESVLGAEKRFSAFMDLLLDKKSGPVGEVTDYVTKKEYQRRGGIHWHILVWVKPGTAPENVVMAELPRASDPNDKRAQHIRRMVQKFQMHRECHPERCFKGYGGKVLSKCKYGFPFKVPQLVEELDEEGIRYLYKRRCKEDCLVVPYNLEILLFWGASMNIQRVSKHGFEMYLAKYVSKPEPSFQVNLSENASDPEKYLRTRVVGSCEAIDVQLGFNQYHISRMTEFLPTELRPKQKFLKNKATLAFLPANSVDVYQKSKFQAYMERNDKLCDITYPMYFQWWRKANGGEQSKGENCVKKGVAPSVGYKGIDEFDELILSMQNRSDLMVELSAKLDVLVDNLNSSDSSVTSGIVIVLGNVLSDDILGVCKKHLAENGYGDILCDSVSDDDITKATTLINNAELLDDEFVAKFKVKLHWLHKKLLMCNEENEITVTPLYIMLQAHPPGSMLMDTDGNYWIRRARACVTRHRFISLDDQEAFYEQIMILAGIIPGPNEPSLHVNSFLEPLVADLQNLWKGVEIETSEGNNTFFCCSHL